MNRKIAQPLLRRAQAGFTLVEIMVVVVIIGMLATLVATNVIGQSDEARKKIALTDCRSIAGAVALFRSTKGKLPESLEELATKDDNGHSFLEELNKDPWGNDYQLIEGDKRGEWEVISLGADGNQGTDDDISNRLKKSQ